LAAALLIAGCQPTIKFELHAVPGVPGYAGGGSSGADTLPGGLVLCFNSPVIGDMPAE